MLRRSDDPFEVAARQFEKTGARSYLHDPVGFMNKCVLWKPNESLTEYQLEAMDDLPVVKRLAIRGPHGLGKTTTAALLVHWFALTRDAAGIDWKCVTTAGAWRQLEHYLWPEIRKWASRLDWDAVGRRPYVPDKELLNLSLKLGFGSAFAVASSKKELIEGAHADHILYIFDESKAIDADIFDAAEGAFAGGSTTEAYALAQSTPGDPSGRFYEIHQRKAGLEDWKTRHVTLREAIKAGRVSGDWALQRKRQWGPDSALYANRVLGEFHSSDSDSVVPLRWAEAAVARWEEWVARGRPTQPGRRVFGVDPARGGADKTFVAARVGAVVYRLEELPSVADTVVTAKMVANRMTFQTDLAIVDVIGIGAGVVDTLRHMPNKNVHAFNASKASRKRDRTGELKFVNQRAAMWWMLREMLDPSYGPTLCIPPNEDLIGELVAPKWKEVGLGKIQVESKDDIRSRIGRSTDRADALAQCLLTDTEFNDMNMVDGKFEAGEVLLFPYANAQGPDAGHSWWDWNENDDTPIGPEFYEFDSGDRSSVGAGDWFGI